MAVFAAERLVDPHTPDNPTLIDRRFNVNREIPEAQVRALFAAVLDSPLGARVARLIQKRLGRTLQPFDVWYSGFRPRGPSRRRSWTPITKKRYPNAEAYAADMPRLFRGLGFSDGRARFLADRIVVDPRAAPATRSGQTVATTRPTCARASAGTAWTTRATTSPSTRWATTSSRSSRSPRSTTPSCRASRTRPSPRRWRSCSSPATRAARPRRPGSGRGDAARPGRVLGDARDCRRRPRRHGRLALALRAPGRDARPVP